MTFKVAVDQDAVAEATKVVKIATFRRGAGVFFKDFPIFVENLKIQQVISMCQSESDGHISLTIAYR